MTWISALERLPQQGERIIISWVGRHCSMPLYCIGTFVTYSGEICARVDVSGQLQYVRVSDGQVYWIEIPPHPATNQMKTRQNEMQRAFLESMLKRQQQDLAETLRQLEEVS